MNEEKKLSYPEITMRNVDGSKHFKFQPQKDITAWESAKLVELYAFALASKNRCDWETFVNDNNLQRHFIETQIEE